MTAFGAVSSLLRYPVMSLAAEGLAQADLVASGIAGDRGFGLVDIAGGEVAAPEKHQRWRPAARIATRLADGGRLEMAIPGQAWRPALEPGAREALSDFMGFATEIRPFGDGSGIVPRYEPMAIHLLTSSSLAELRRLLPGSAIAVPRFRPNIVVDMPAEAGVFPEAGWIGRRIVMGTTVLEVAEPSTRCGFVVIEQDGLPFDTQILRTIVQKAGRAFGVRCKVVRGGRLRVGDAFSLGGPDGDAWLSA